jgi:hypothetical protein
MLWIAVIVTVLAGVYFVGRLGYMLVGAATVVRRASAQAREKLQRELALLSTEELRQRLLHDSYLSGRLGHVATVKEFLTRIAQRDEVALAHEYSRSRLYRLLAKAERAGGATGRPEAVDVAPEISAVLQALVAKSARNETSAV